MQATDFLEPNNKYVVNSGAIVTVDGEEYEVLLGQNDLKTAVKILAEKIYGEYYKKDPVIIGIAMGGLPFMFNLCEHLTGLEFDFDPDMMRYSRYGTDNNADENISLSCEPKISLVGRHIIFVDDVFEKGITAKAAKKYAEENRALSVEFCIACIKEKYAKDFSIKFSILKNLNENWLVGYGMNSHKTGRFSPYIAQKI